MPLPLIDLPPRDKRFKPQGLAIDDPSFGVHGDVVELFAPIGGDVTPGRISAALREVGGRPVTLQINSPGGDIFAGATIYNLLAGHTQPVHVEVLGVAASAAALIAMAGSTVKMARNAQLMIHNAHGVAVGNRHMMTAFSDLLAKLDTGMAAVFAARSGAAVKTIAAMMDAETWFTADEAIALGLADALLPQDALPKPHAQATAAPRTKADLERLLHAAGLSKTIAIRAADKAWPAITNDTSDDLARVVAAFTNSAAQIGNLK